MTAKNDDIVIYARPAGYDRFGIASDIQDACNPSGVARELVRIIEDAMRDPKYTGTTFVRQDPAVRAVVDKLASLCGVQSFDIKDCPHAAIHKILLERHAKPAPVEAGPHAQVLLDDEVGP